MKELEDSNAELYMNGIIANEIEHLLVMRLHDKNTINEIEELKYKIHDLMMSAYNKAQER